VVRALSFDRDARFNHYPIDGVWRIDVTVCFGRIPHKTGFIPANIIAVKRPRTQTEWLQAISAITTAAPIADHVAVSARHAGARERA
jgi:hypothetical protein